MKFSKYMLITVLLISTTLSMAAEKISLDDVVSEVSERNYQVLQSAEKVFQARAEIAVARANLLPRLNFWTIIKGILNPVSLVESILTGESGLAPFLVPSNWFRFKESQILFDAEKEAYRGVWANEVLNAKSMYVNLLLDIRLLEIISGHAAEVEQVYKIAKTRETLGTIPAGIAQELEIRWLKLEDDTADLERLIGDEFKALSYALGVSFSDDIQIEGIDLPDIKNLEPLNYADFEFRAVDSSPEKRQLDHLLRVIPYLKKEVKYSFFGNSSASRGVAGGIFDNLPIPDGWGFGNGSSIRVIEGQEQIFNLQRTGVVEVIKRQLLSVINNYNFSIERYGNVERRLNVAENRVRQYISRLQIGENIDLLELTDAYHRGAFERMGVSAHGYRFVVNNDKFHRLIFHGDYKKSKESLQKIDEQRKKDLEELTRFETTEREERRKRRRP